MFDSTRNLTEDFCRIHLLSKETISFIHRNNLWGLPLDRFKEEQDKSKSALLEINELRPIFDIVNATCHYVRHNGSYLLDAVVSEYQSDVDTMPKVNITKYIYTQNDIIEIFMGVDEQINTLIGTYQNLKTGTVLPINLDDQNVLDTIKKYTDFTVTDETKVSTIEEQVIEKNTGENEQRGTTTTCTYEETNGGDDKKLIRMETFYSDGPFKGLLIEERDFEYGNKEVYYYEKPKTELTNNEKIIATYEKVVTKLYQQDKPISEQLLSVTKGVVIIEELPEQCFHDNLKPTSSVRYIDEELIQVRGAGGGSVRIETHKIVHHYDAFYNFLYTEELLPMYVEAKEEDPAKPTSVFYTTVKTQDQQLKSYPVNGKTAVFPLIYSGD